MGFCIFKIRISSIYSLAISYTETMGLDCRHTHSPPPVALLWHLQHGSLSHKVFLRSQGKVRNRLTKESPKCEYVNEHSLPKYNPL